MTPGPYDPYHPALPNVRNALKGRQFDNVLDLDASRKVKKATGKAVPIRKSSTPDSPEMTKHENEAMALGNPETVKKSKFDKVMDYLGLGDQN